MTNMFAIKEIDNFEEEKRYLIERPAENPSFLLSEKNDIRFRIGDSQRISRDGRKITFTRPNPTTTLRSLKKSLEAEGIVNHLYKAHTGSNYLNFESNNVSYKIRFANHTKGAYTDFTSHEKKGVELFYGKTGIESVEIDMAENDYGISQIKSLFSDIDKFNLLSEVDNNLYKYSESLLNISDNKNLTSLDTLFPILHAEVQKNIEGQLFSLSQRALLDAQEVFGGDTHYTASNGIKVIDRGGIRGISTQLPIGWRGKTKIPEQEAREEYLSTDKYILRQKSFKKETEYIDNAEKPYRDILEKYKTQSSSQFRLLAEKDPANLTVKNTTIKLDDLSEPCDVIPHPDTLITSIKEYATELRTPIHIIRSIEDIPKNSICRKQIESGANIKAWFNIETKEIVIFLPHVNSLEDAKLSVYHEVIAHYGLRKMYGTHFDTLLDNVFINAIPEIQGKILYLTNGDPAKLREGVEEYLSKLAEKGFNRPIDLTFFQKVKSTFIDMLHQIGVHLNFKLNDSDLCQILCKSYQNLKFNSGLDTSQNSYKPSLQYEKPRFLNKELSSSGCRTLITDVTPSSVSNPSTTSEFRIHDKSTGLTEPLQPNGINLGKESPETIKQILSGAKTNTSSGLVQLSKSVTGWGITVVKQAFTTVDASAEI